MDASYAVIGMDSLGEDWQMKQDVKNFENPPNPRKQIERKNLRICIYTFLAEYSWWNVYVMIQQLLEMGILLSMKKYHHRELSLLTVESNNTVTVVMILKTVYIK